MISTNVFQIAQANAQALKATINKSITASGRSILSNLVGLSYIGSIPDSDKVTMADVLAAATDDSLDGPSAHTAQIGGYIDTLIPLVSSHISFVQNTVCPKVFSFDEKYSEVVRRLDQQTPYGLFDIVELTAPAPLGNDNFMMLIERFADKGVPAANPVVTLPAQSVQELLEIMRVSSQSVNDDIVKWIAEQGDDWLLDLWHHYFAGANTSPSGNGHQFKGSFNGIGNLPTFERLNVALAVFLLARGLLDNPLDNSAMSLSQWRDTMDSISRFAGAQVQYAIGSLKTIERLETVILGVTNDSKRILVNSPTYTKYLDAGGTIEDILGAAVSNKAQTYTLGTLQEQGEGFREVWKNFQAMGQSSLNARAAVTMRNEAKALFANTLRDLTDDEIQILNMKNQSRESLQTQADECIDSLSLKDLRDCSHLAVCLIAGIRYSHTPAKQFLCDMKEAEEAGCETPAEAAAVAAINYVCDFLTCDLALTDA